MAVTFTVMDAVCVADAAVPVTVMVYVSSGVVASAATVSVELAPAVTLVGANVAVAPAGRPVAERVTVSGVPAVAVVDTVVVPELPWTTLTVVGDALIEKSLTGGALSSQKPRP